jgi:hypothetical protein
MYVNPTCRAVRARDAAAGGNRVHYTRGAVVIGCTAAVIGGAGTVIACAATVIACAAAAIAAHGRYTGPRDPIFSRHV